MKRLICLFLFLLSSLAAEEIDLRLSEKGIYSENGEDGILRKIFEVIKPSSKYLVELGAGNGVVLSHTYLLRKQGWHCALFDRANENPAMNLYKVFLTAESVNEVLEKAQVPLEFDLLSIDIHYNDFYLWKALDARYKPAVVVIEYNATHLPNEDKIVKYRPYYSGDDTNYFGASILALYNLGRSKGYSLVYVEKAGMNLFFVRDDVLKNTDVVFKNTNQVDKLYRPPTYGQGQNGGHRQDPRNRAYLKSTDLLEASVNGL